MAAPLAVWAIARDEYAYDWFESIRWPDGPVCPHCGVAAHAYHLKPKDGLRRTRTGSLTPRKVWKCGSCRKQFTVTVGTCMERSKIPLHKWARAFFLLANAENGLSWNQLSRKLEISPESAFFMVRRLCYAFAPNELQQPEKGDADE